MSYRNPGNLYVPDPNAFLKTFLTGIEKHRAYYEEQAEKERLNQEKLDYQLAKFNSDMDYPTIAATYGDDVANAVKGVINTKYVDSGMFANADQQGKSLIFDEIQMQLINPLAKLGKSVTLDPVEVDLFSLDSKFDKFISFQNSKMNGFEVITQDGNIAFKFKDEDGKSQVLTANDVPDKIDNLKKESDIFDSIEGIIKDNVNTLDYSYRNVDLDAIDQEKLEKRIQDQATKVYSLLDDQDKRALWKRYMYEKTGMYFNYNDFPEDMTEEEKQQFLNIEDGVIQEYIANDIKQKSNTVNRIQQRIIQEEEQKIEQNQKQIEMSNYIQSFQNLIMADNKKSLVEFLDADEVLPGSVSIDGNVVKIEAVITNEDNEFVPAEFDISTPTGAIKLMKYVVGKKYTGQDKGTADRMLDRYLIELLDITRQQEAKAEAEAEAIRLQQEEAQRLTPEKGEESLNAIDAQISRLEKIISVRKNRYSVDGETYSRYQIQQSIKELKKQKENLSIQMEKLTGDPIEIQDTLSELQIEINNLQKEYDKGKGVYTINGERLSRADLKSLIEEKQNRFNILNEQEVDTSFAQ